MEAMRNGPQQSASATRVGKRTISDTAAQVWAAIITVAVFSGLAAALNALFERLGGA